MLVDLAIVKSEPHCLTRCYWDLHLFTHLVNMLLKMPYSLQVRTWKVHENLTKKKEKCMSITWRVVKCILCAFLMPFDYFHNQSKGNIVMYNLLLARLVAHLKIKALHFSRPLVTWQIISVILFACLNHYSPNTGANWSSNMSYFF